MSTTQKVEAPESFREVNARALARAQSLGITANAIIEACYGLRRQNILPTPTNCPRQPNLQENCANCLNIGQATEAARIHEQTTPLSA